MAVFMTALFSLSACGQDPEQQDPILLLEPDEDASVDMGQVAPPCDTDESVEAGACVPCAPGTRRDAGDDPLGPDTTCIERSCGADERVAGNACAPCAPGTTNDAGDDTIGPDTTCDALRCAEDERVRANACAPCDAGSINGAGDDASGRDTTCDAVLCGVNERVDENACVACSTGEFNAAGDDASGGDTPCDGSMCPSNQAVTDNVCVPCPAGTANDAGDDASGPDTTCDALICDADEYVSSNMCAGCSAGTTNDAGDDASGPDTSCEAVSCAEDERVQGRACVACDPGTTNDAGDDASGMNTSCEAELCGADEYVSSNACVACPVDAFNAEGDDATGPDTTCDPTVCQADEYVSSSACVACPAGTTNAAGDRALGPDTICDAVLCGVDEYVSSNACVACAVGTTNAPYESAAGADTVCDGPDPCLSIFGATCEVLSESFVDGPYSPAGGGDFGESVALSGDTLVVGAPKNPNLVNGRTIKSGAVFVFTRRMGTWTEQASLVSNTNDEDAFGASVSISGDTIVVGVPDEDSASVGVDGVPVPGSETDSGAAYVFTRTNTTWSKQAYLKASNTREDDHFGDSVAVDGDTVVIGAPGDNGFSPAVVSGSAYVFARSGTTWTQQAHLESANPDLGDRFGTSIALEADTLVVGASGEDSSSSVVDGNQTNNSRSGSGAVFVFTRSTNTWTQSSYLKASNTGSNDGFGRAVALSGDTLVVGASGEDSSATGVGGTQSNNSAGGSGAAYVFTRSGGSGTWSQQAYLKASNTSQLASFGSSVAILGDTVVIGAPGEDSDETGSNGGTNWQDSGAAYVFTRSAGAWSQQAFFKPSDIQTPGGVVFNPARSAFGASVALDGEILAIGSPDGGTRGRVHVYQSPTTCSTDEYVSSNTCVSCAVGATNALGDDVSGMDTSCQERLCLTNEYVSFNTCEVCPPGTTNASGDGALGMDTSCDGPAP